MFWNLINDSTFNIKKLVWVFTTYTNIRQPMVWITNNLNSFFINLDNKYGTNFSAKQVSSTEVMSSTNKKIISAINEFVSETFVLGIMDFATQYAANFYMLLIVITLG